MFLRRSERSAPETSDALPALGRSLTATPPSLGRDRESVPRDRRPVWVRRLGDRIVVEPDCGGSIRVERPVR